ncbi:type ISP restriction/modification enzyme [Corynebacterium sp.]|uniref:type ISP restriction/modification enzyme n=1 Tax=Corynebacterium sp. TaxID=1720 RepID=UPI0026487108|nr:type ISP restriction/modification enzyme [Corynebacterium sp.]MDN6136336.1 N-6 DNA methylase [Corynebacterium sp.]
MTSSFSIACASLASSLHNIDRELERDKRTSPEDQLKTPISTFLTELGKQRTRQVNVVTEHRQVAGDNVQGVRLDLGIKDGYGRLVGHIELKAPGRSANPFRQAGWSKHDKKQWKRLENHTNLIYTNGWEWTLLRHGSDRPIAHILLSPDKNNDMPEDQVQRLSDLLDQFLSWRPTSPSTPKGLANQLAPLTRLLRDSVIDVITDSTEDALDKLYASWKQDLMPGATKADFADSFAQTFTYALLLARIESDVDSINFHAKEITPGLKRNGHRLIGAVLELMSQERNRELVEGPVALLEATIGAVDSEKFTSETDPWLYFYEDFLAAYDPIKRADAGVYYTPVEVVKTQVRLLDEVLKTRFGRPAGLGDESTNILDPAAGTATYALEIARHVIENSASKQDAARSLTKRLYAFELLMGPYSVAHMRLTKMLEDTGIELDKDGVQVFLTNSLTDPGDVSGDNQQISLWEVMEDINEENRRAGLVKNQQTPIRVVVSNPPYRRSKRAQAIGAGSTSYKNVILEETNGNRPLIDDFIEPLKVRGLGGQAKNLYNFYIYFIRWAIWKACEQHKNETGIVSYITSSSYLRGPGFAGVREYMRRVFDELWIIDLGGEGRGARKEENVFNIKTPVAIFVGIQHPNTSTGKPKRHADRMKQQAKVYYQRVYGTKKEKLSFVGDIDVPEKDDKWTQLTNGDWTDKFVPPSSAALSDGVPLDLVFPWYFSGSKAGRKWVIATKPELLKSRLKKLQEVETIQDGREIFDESPSGRKYENTSESSLVPASSSKSASISSDPKLMELPTQRYGYRSFDRQFCIADHRVIDRPGAAWGIQSDDQLFLVTLTSTTLGDGPAVTLSPYVPDLHFFCNRGGKDIHPLYRSAGTSQPNISASLRAALNDAYGREVEPFEIAAYVVGLLGTSAYTERFADELAESVAHVPFTADADLFAEVVDFGRSIIFEQTWGERGAKLNQFGQPVGQRFRGAATIAVPTPDSDYPESWSYDADSHQLFVGGGRFDNVSPAVANFEVSDMNVVGSWLGYRMKTPAGTSSSPLDKIQADTWQHDGELLELLWQLEFMIKAEPRGAELLDKVVTGKIIPPSTLGVPTDAERKAPAKKKPGELTLED